MMIRIRRIRIDCRAYLRPRQTNKLKLDDDDDDDEVSIDFLSSSPGLLPAGGMGIT